eukprot:GHVN01066904.1.p1 GENE.GHVN01066904.1~~GHVN01066904.1.p1  ORF type:complete len:986 (-),score=85.05 GHVN01066904.1:176-2941(-)
MRTVGMSWAPIPNTPRSVASSNSTVAGSLFQDARASSRFATFLCGRSDVHASDVAAAISSRPIPPITRLPAGQTPTEERRKMKAEYRYPADLHAYPLESVTWNGSKFPRNLVNVRPKEYPRTTQPIKRPQQDILHLDSNRGVQTVPADPPRGVRSTGKMDPAAGGRRHEVVKAWFTDTIGDEGVMAPVDEEEDDQPYLMDQSSPVFSLEGCPSPPHGGMSNRLNPESAHPRTTTGLPPPTTSALDIDGSLRYDATDKVRMPADTHAFLSDINLSGIEVPPNLLNPQKRPVTRPMRVFSFGRVAPRAVPVGITPTPLPVDHCTSKQESTSENSRLPARQPHIRSLLNYLAKRGPYPSPLPWHSPISDLAYANPLEAIGVAGWECQPLRSLGLMSALIDVVPTIRIFLHVPFKYLSLWLRGYIRRNRLDKLYLDHLNNLEDPRFAEAGNRLSRMTAGVGAPSEGAVEPMIRHVSFSKQAAAKPHSGFFQRPPRFYVPQRLWLSENDTPRAPSHDRRWPPVEAYRHQTDHLINKLNARVNGDDTVALTELELIELCEHLVRISAIRYGRLPRTILLVSDMSGENLFPFGMRLPPHEVCHLYAILFGEIGEQAKAAEWEHLASIFAPSEKHISPTDNILDHKEGKPGLLPPGLSITAIKDVSLAEWDDHDADVRKCRFHFLKRLIETYIHKNDVHMLLTLILNLSPQLADNPWWKARLTEWSLAYAALLMRFRMYVPRVRFINSSPFDEVRQLDEDGRIKRIACSGPYDQESGGSQVVSCNMDRLKADHPYKHPSGRATHPAASEHLRSKNVTSGRERHDSAIVVEFAEKINVFPNYPLLGEYPLFFDYPPQLAGPAKCYGCTTPSNCCAVCGESVQGVWTSCPVCLHGGHAHHIVQWFSFKGSEGRCPAGCNHKCQFPPVTSSF